MAMVKKKKLSTKFVLRYNRSSKNRSRKGDIGRND